MRYVMAMRLLRWWMVMKIGFEESFPVLVISKKKKNHFKQGRRIKITYFPIIFKGLKAMFFLWRKFNTAYFHSSV